MKISLIKKNLNNDSYNIFLENGVVISLSGQFLLESKVYKGQELSNQQIANLQKYAKDNEYYNMVCNYVSLRQRSRSEISNYLRKKQCPSLTIQKIISRLEESGVIDDQKFAQAYLNDRQALRPTSRRKLAIELQQKNIDPTIINKVLSNRSNDDGLILKELIIRKRKQSRYEDEVKLIQYLIHQGFNYGDIKQAIKELQD